MKISISVVLLLLFATDAVSGAWDGCSKTAHTAMSATLMEAMADFLNAKAKASLLQDEEAAAIQTSAAEEELEEAQALAGTVLAARLDLCQALDEDYYSPMIDPADFLTPGQASAEPNPYFPLVLGRVYNYEAITEEGEKEAISFNVTRKTREILGVTCTEIRDIVMVDGEIHEDTRDWYAQHVDGSVWYFGEISLNYENDKVDNLDGSWEAGLDGAQPGVIMQAMPMVGDIYREELDMNNAEDYAEVLVTGVNLTVKGTEYIDCIQTLNGSPTEPGTIEHKYWCPGVGTVQEVDPGTGLTLDLVSFTDDGGESAIDGTEGEDDSDGDVDDPKDEDDEDDEDDEGDEAIDTTVSRGPPL